jgi:ankyrin repeat protein
LGRRSLIGWAEPAARTHHSRWVQPHTDTSMPIYMTQASHHSRSLAASQEEAMEKRRAKMLTKAEEEKAALKQWKINREKAEIAAEAARAEAKAAERRFWEQCKRDNMEKSSPGVARVLEAFEISADTMKARDEPLQQLFVAAGSGDEPAAAQLVTLAKLTGKDLANEGINSMSAIMVASHFGHANVVDHLLKQGANVDACDMAGVTALHYACEAGRVDVVCTLLSHGADAQRAKNNGETPEAIAERRGFAAVTAVLTNPPDVVAKAAARVQAAIRGKRGRERAKDKAATPQETDEEREARRSREAAAAREAAAERAAAERRRLHAQLADILDEFDCEPPPLDGESGEPSVDPAVGKLFVACWEADTDGAIAILAKRRALANATIDTVTPLMTACFYGAEGVVEALLDCDADLEAVATKGALAGSTALLFAVEQNSTAAVWALLLAGADPLKAQTDGETAIDIAERKGFDSVTALFRHPPEYVEKARAHHAEEKRKAAEKKAKETKKQA